MPYRQPSFANISTTVLVEKGGMATSATQGIAPRASSLIKPRSWSLLRFLDKASLAFNRGITTWATAGRL